MLKSLVKFWNKLEENILVATFMVMVAVIFIQVIMRYIFNNSLSWSEELVRYLFIWQIWWGASVGIKNNDHIRIEILTSHLSEGGRKLLNTLINLLLLAFYLFLIVEGTKYVASVMAKNMTSTGLQIPLALIYLSLPFGSCLVAVRLICRIVYEVIHMGETSVKTIAKTKGDD